MNKYEPLPPYRRAESSEDIAAIYRQMKYFEKTQGNIYEIPSDIDSIITTVKNVMDEGICIVGPNSCAGAKIQPFPANYNYQVAYVMFWYFRKMREINIFMEICRLCKEAGATHVNAASHFPNNTVLRYYAKLGLKPAETQCISRL